MSYQPIHRMPRGADIAAFSRDGELVLVVEVTGGKHLSLTDAARFRKDLLENDLIVNACFWLLVTDTQLLLWRRETGWDCPPDCAASTQSLSRGHLSRELAKWSGYTCREVLGSAVRDWLDDFAHEIREPDATSELDQLLSRFGLHERIKRGEVRMEMPRDRRY
jgi:hypothetical protein